MRLSRVTNNVLFYPPYLRLLMTCYFFSPYLGLLLTFYLFVTASGY